MPKNAQTTAQLHSSRTLESNAQNSPSQALTVHEPDVQAGFRKGIGTREIKLPTSVEASEKQESSGKTSSSVLLTTTKPLTVWITKNWKILKEMGYQAT